MVLLVVATLSAIVLTTLAVVNHNVQSQYARASEMEVEALALKGASLGTHPSVNRDDDLLHFVSEDGLQSYDVEISSEGARINLNSVISRNDKAFLRELFVSWGIGFDEASEVVDALVDWVDQDDIVQLNGAEDGYYDEQGFIGRPYNRPFVTLADVRLVKDFNKIEAVKPDWEDVFTLVGDEQLDIHEAPIEILAVAGDVAVSTAEQYHAQIVGEDEIIGTEDDVTFRSLTTALDSLGVSADPEIRNQISGRFRLRSTVRRVKSVGRVGDTQKEIRLIVRQSDSSPVVLSYQETLSYQSTRE